MATPWTDPRTGRYYLRRQIPALLRPSFGNRVIYKKSLGTRDIGEARTAFAAENAKFEERLSAAREGIAKKRSHSPSELVRRWFSDPAVGNGISGEQRQLYALMRLDTLATDWMDDDVYETDWVAPLNADLEAAAGDRDSFDRLLTNCYRDDVSRVGIYWETTRIDDSLDELCRGFVATLVPDLRQYDPQTSEYEDAQLVEAILARMEQARTGKLADIAARMAPTIPRERTSRLRPTLRLRQLFVEWKDCTQPRPQTALEFEASVDDFIEFANDPPIKAIDADLLYDYRDAAAKLPASMPRADRALPFSQRVAKHASSQDKISAATLKKRVGGIQAMLSHAFSQRWTANNLGRGIQIVGYTKTKRNRRSFQDHELATLFAAPLFTDRTAWDDRSKRAENEALFWVFLLALTSGARLEEVGQVAVTDVREDSGIVYLDIDDYALVDNGTSKHIKTDGSMRLIPVHRRLLDLGFLQYRDAVVAKGESALFPALRENSVGKRTKELSRLANRIIDRHVSLDARLVFHSLRHTFKSKGHDAGLSDRTLDQICGHAPINEGGRYGSEPRLRTLERELQLIDFDCINWDSVKAYVKPA